MIISIASGKGGTGKTTISTNLALSIPGSVSLLDCDVEEPNAHLFIKPQITSQEVVYTFIPSVDSELCTGCKKCTDICRFNALAVVGTKVIVFPELCHSCGGCMEVCPENALTEDKRELGIVEEGSRGSLQFLQGISRIGEAMSPPLIKAVRAKAPQVDTTIIDAPPGTSCPVITSMVDTDFVLLVTEPTPFGLHDLILAVEAVKVLGIPCGLVINRADLGYKEVHQYADNEGLPILMEIPFDKSIAEIYSKGDILVEERPEWKARFVEIHTKIKEILAQQQKTL